MLIRKDQPAAIQSAAVIHQVVIRRSEHIYINPAEIKLLQLHPSLIRIIKEDILSYRDFLSSGSILFLPFLIPQMICRSDLRGIIHFLCSQLHLDITS